MPGKFPFWIDGISCAFTADEHIADDSANAQLIFISEKYGVAPGMQLTGLVVYQGRRVGLVQLFSLEKEEYEKFDKIGIDIEKLCHILLSSRFYVSSAQEAVGTMKH